MPHAQAGHARDGNGLSMASIILQMEHKLAEGVAAVLEVWAPIVAGAVRLIGVVYLFAALEFVVEFFAYLAQQYYEGNRLRVDNFLH